MKRNDGYGSDGQLEIIITDKEILDFIDQNVFRVSRLNDDLWFVKYGEKQGEWVTNNSLRLAVCEAYKLKWSK